MDFCNSMLAIRIGVHWVWMRQYCSVVLLGTLLCIPLLANRIGVAASKRQLNTIETYVCAMASKSYFFCFGVEIRFGSLIAVFRCFSPHLCVGFLFLILYPGFFPASSRLAPPPLHTHLSHTIFVNHLCQPSSFTHHLSHTISHTPSLTHIFVNHQLSHTIFHTPSFTHTIFHVNHLCQPPSFTHHLLHTIFRFPPGVALGESWRRIPSFCVAGVALLALGWLWWRAWAGFGRRWRRGTLHGRRGTW